MQQPHKRHCVTFVACAPATNKNYGYHHRHKKKKRQNYRPLQHLSGIARGCLQATLHLSILTRHTQEVKIGVAIDVRCLFIAKRSIGARNFVPYEQHALGNIHNIRESHALKFKGVFGLKKSICRQAICLAIIVSIIVIYRIKSDTANVECILVVARINVAGGKHSHTFYHHVAVAIFVKIVDRTLGQPLRKLVKRESVAIDTRQTSGRDFLHRVGNHFFAQQGS